MSKTFKRVAAVAALALGLGGLTGVAAHAGTTPVIKPISGSTSDAGTAGTAPTSIATVGKYVIDTVTAGTADKVYTITSTGVGSISIAPAPSAATNSTTDALVVADTNKQSYTVNSATSVTWYAGGYPGAHVFATGQIQFALTSAVAGTQTITVQGDGNVLPVTHVITWGAAPAASAAYTAAASFIDDGSTRPSAANSAAVLNYPKAATSDVRATIAINVKDGSNNDLNGVAISASITGPGLITLATGTSAGSQGLVRAASLTATDQASTNHATIGISGDGTSGTSVITVSAGTTTLFTKTVTFYGTVATLTATQNLFIAKAGTTSLKLGSNTVSDSSTTVATTPAVVIVAKDANGFVVPDLTITAKSADATVIASGDVTQEDGTASTNGADGKGYYLASVTAAAAGTSGKSTTVTFNTVLADGTIISSNPVTFTLGGSVASGTISAAFAADSYNAGEKMSLVFTAKDSAGNLPYDGQSVLAATATSNVAISQGSLPGTSLQLVNGTVKASFYAPIIGGAFTVSGYSNTTAGSTAAGLAGTKDLTASATVVGSSDAVAQAAVDAAQEATDAANAAYDAANNAMDSADAATAAAQEASDNAAAALAAVTELATTVANLVAKVNAMAATIAKIAKKVKA